MRFRNAGLRACASQSPGAPWTLAPLPYRRGSVRILVFALVVPLSAQTLPDAPARDTVKKICGNCHELATVVSSRRTKLAWEQMVDDMITRGAEGSDADMESVVAYLTAYFG